MYMKPQKQNIISRKTNKIVVSVRLQFRSGLQSVDDSGSQFNYAKVLHLFGGDIFAPILYTACKYSLIIFYNFIQLKKYY